MTSFGTWANAYPSQDTFVEGVGVARLDTGVDCCTPAHHESTRLFIGRERVCRKGVRPAAGSEGATPNESASPPGCPWASRTTKELQGGAPTILYFDLRPGNKKEWLTDVIGCAPGELRHVIDGDITHHHSRGICWRSHSVRSAPIVVSLRTGLLFNAAESR